MLAFIDELKAQQTDENNILMLNSIRNELDGKRYGLVWEEHTEHVDEQLIDNIPVFKEDKSREIVSDENLPYNFLLEGDNLHSLKLLEKTHKGKIDVIYIDPPYNTGAKDWKYDNNYVDSNDTFRHSKWLSMMEKRLRTAKSLMKRDGILICAIDHFELFSLGALMDEIFGEENRIGICAVIHKPEGRNQEKFFGTSHEYALYYAKNKSLAKFNSVVLDEEMKLTFDKVDDKGAYKQKNFIRLADGKYATREAKPNFWYPIYVSPDLQSFSINKHENWYEVYPTIKNGVERTWKTLPKTFLNLVEENSIEAELIDGRVEIFEKLRENQVIKSHWIKKEYHGYHFGARILNDILGKKIFDFPKSLYLMVDIMKLVSKKNATILDFFAGSGTTGHAVMELNKEDGGNRKFILCTNNENNICEDVTYQRLKTVITGKRKDGSDYSEGIPANLKYFKTDWTKRHPENYFLSHALLLHITEMIELQNAIKVDNKKYVVVLREKDFTDYVVNNADRANIKKLWIREDLILSNEQNKLLQTIKFAYIPREYFSVELQEVGE